jgi:hypothetical protein
VSLLCHGARMIVHSCLLAPKTIEQYAGILLVERYTMNIQTFERVVCALFMYLLFFCVLMVPFMTFFVTDY